MGVPFLQVTKHWESARSPRKPKLLEKSENEKCCPFLNMNWSMILLLEGKKGIRERPVVNLPYNLIACFSMFTSTLEGGFPGGPCRKCCWDPNYKNIFCPHFLCFMCNIICTKPGLFFMYFYSTDIFMIFMIPRLRNLSSRKNSFQVQLLSAVWANSLPTPHLK